MAIFGVIEADLIVQENEKIRLDVSKSFITQDEADVTLVEVEPHTGDGFISVFTTVGAEPQENWFLDWIYPSAGSKVISLRITTDGAPVVVTKTISAVTVLADALFATDEDLKSVESDVMKYLPAGKSSWSYVHRKVQERILTEIYKSRIFATDGTKLEKTEVLDKAEVREWATFMALAMIYGGIQNASNDVFIEKAKRYEIKSHSYEEYSMNVLRLDYNKDTVLNNDTERLDFRSGGLIRR